MSGCAFCCLTGDSLVKVFACFQPENTFQKYILDTSVAGASMEEVSLVIGNAVVDKTIAFHDLDTNSESEGRSWNNETFLKLVSRARES